MGLVLALRKMVCTDASTFDDAAKSMLPSNLRHV
jgi:hypothetical protein